MMRGMLHLVTAAGFRMGPSKRPPHIERAARRTFNLSLSLMDTCSTAVACNLPQVSQSWVGLRPAGHDLG